MHSEMNHMHSEMNYFRKPYPVAVSARKQFLISLRRLSRAPYAGFAGLALSSDAIHIPPTQEKLPHMLWHST